MSNEIPKVFRITLEVANLDKAAAFYAKLRSLDDMVDHTVGRALDQLGVEHERIRRWGERRAVLRPVDDA